MCAALQQFLYVNGLLFFFLGGRGKGNTIDRLIIEKISKTRCTPPLRIICLYFQIPRYITRHTVWKMKSVSYLRVIINRVMLWWTAEADVYEFYMKKNASSEIDILLIV